MAMDPADSLPRQQRPPRPSESQGRTFRSGDPSEAGHSGNQMAQFNLRLGAMLI